MKKLATLTRVTALATTLSLALIGMPGGKALAAPLEADLDATFNADPGPPDANREAGGFGYVAVFQVKRNNVWSWYVKAENLRKSSGLYYICNDDSGDESLPCSTENVLETFKTDVEGDALVSFVKPTKPGGDWVHVARVCVEEFVGFGCVGGRFAQGQLMKILTGELQKGRGGGKPGGKP